MSVGVCIVVWAATVGRVALAATEATNTTSADDTHADDAHGDDAHADDSAHGEEHPSVFKLGEHWDSVEMVACASVIIAITIVVEWGLHSLYHKFSHGNPVKKQVLDKLVKEMFVLGFISFLVFFFEQTLDLGTQGYFLELEFMHMALFFVGLVFVVQCFYFLFWVTRFTRRWDRMTNSSALEVVRRASQLQLSLARVWSLPIGRDMFQRMFLIEGMEMKILESEFRSWHHLPPSFDFTRYLSLCLQRSFVRLVDVSPVTWCIALGMMWLLVGIERAAGIEDTHDILLYLWMPVGFVYLLVFIGVFVNLSLLRNRLVRTSKEYSPDGLRVATSRYLWHEHPDIADHLDAMQQSASDRLLRTSEECKCDRELGDDRKFTLYHGRVVHPRNDDRIRITTPFWLVDRVLQVALVLNALYFSWFFCMTAWADSLSLTEKLVTFVPGALNILLVIPFVLKHHQTAESCVYLDHESFVDVIEHMNVIHQTKKLVIAKIHESLGLPPNAALEDNKVEDVLREAFKYVSRDMKPANVDMLRQMFRKLGVVRTEREVRKFMRVVDLDRSNTIEFEEFTRVLMGKLHGRVVSQRSGVLPEDAML